MIEVDYFTPLRKTFLTFTAVPEQVPENLSDVLETIDKHHADNLGSYGAFIVRGAGNEFAERCITDFGKRRDIEKYLCTMRFGSLEDISDGPLHEDSGKPNNVTAHVTLSGRADFIILPGGDAWDGPEEALIGKLNSNLFARSEYAYLDKLPTRSLSTVVGVDDVLIFDHSQPHAFRSLSSDRLSRAYYHRI